MTEQFDRHIEALERIIIMFKADPARAAQLLAEEKSALEGDFTESSDEMLRPALYNALATIRTSPEQEKPTGQLISAISDAREELMIIRDACM